MKSNTNNLEKNIQQTDEVDLIQKRYDDGDETRYYKEKGEDWSFGKNYLHGAIETDGQSNDSEFDTDEIETIHEMTAQIQSGEIETSQETVEQLRERALALVPHVDINLTPVQVERTLLYVLVIRPDPDFEKQVDQAISELYDNRPGVNAEILNRIHSLVHQAAEVAAHPDDYIQLMTPEELNHPPSIDRILETANAFVVTRYIARAVMKKIFDEEEAAELKNAEANNSPALSEVA